MAKARTANFGRYAIRMAMGVKAKRSSAFNACVGAQLKGKKYSGAAPGKGGRLDPRIRSAFTSAVNSCKGK